VFRAVTNRIGPVSGAIRENCFFASPAVGKKTPVKTINPLQTNSGLDSAKIALPDIAMG
jgi:hypothetical protein